MSARRGAVLWLALGLGACSAEVSRIESAPECKLNRFRACPTDACVGYQECVSPGVWSECSCNVMDAAYADAGDSGDSAPE